MLVWCRKCPEDDEREITRMNIRRTFEQNLKDEGLTLEHDIKVLIILQCFDAVGWVAGRASGL